MSENWLRLIPTAPTWVAEQLGEARGKAALLRMAPDADEVSAETYDEIVFVDCGGNFQAVYCPSCGAELVVPWWQEAMDGAYDSRFIHLDVTMPCCGMATSLNDLRYDWPQGFARWQVFAWSPGRMELTDEEVCELEQAVGHSLRQIWTHI